jgi:glycosyltransferase involved in cell wall biosynthesis
MIQSNPTDPAQVTAQPSRAQQRDFTVYFAIPGDINSLTGGYGYDRELIKELTRLGFRMRVLNLPAEFPNAGAEALRETAQIFAGIPAGATVIVDGLAFGAMDEIAERESQRLRLIALCHHPLALETGISEEDSQRFKKTETRALSFARCTIVTSAMTGKILASDFAVPSEKILLAQPGTARQTFSACNNPVPILLTVATLTKRKAHDLLIAALAHVSHLPWQARFVGGKDFDPQWYDYLFNLVREKKFQDRITFVGNVENIATEFLAADVFVLPSHFEGYGMAFAEALAFGLPVIGAKAGAVADLVPDTAGILIPPGDLSALTTALEGLLTNASERRQLQTGAQNAAKNLPTWADCAHKVADLLIKVRNL